MASPKLLSRYPIEFFELFITAKSHVVKVHCRTLNEATSLRQQLYGFRQALFSEERKEDEEVRKAAHMIKMRIDQHTLIVEPIIDTYKTTIQNALLDVCETGVEGEE